MAAVKSLTVRHAVLRGIREFFWARGFIEVETPIVLAYPSQEPYLEPLRTTVHDARGAAHGGFLRMSPEFSLKKCIAAGVERVFELASVFRDGEHWGGAHNPEFTMLEWYRVGATYRELMEDTEALVAHILEEEMRHPHSRCTEQAHTRSPMMSYQGTEINLASPWERLTMREAWQRYAGLDLDQLLNREAMARACTERGLTVHPRDTFDDCFFKIHLTDVEPKLGQERPTFLMDWPMQLAALAKRRDDDPHYAERVELYLGGLELANGFSELADPVEQRARFEEDRVLRAQLGKVPYPIDEAFLAALPSMPPTAGIALGVDRLIMLFLDASSIDDVRWLPASELWVR